jgi:hypothetical protein
MRVLVLVVLAILVVPDLTFAALRPAQAPVEALAAMCAGSDGSDGAVTTSPNPELTTGLPPGLAFRLLASQPVAALPRQHLVLVLKQVTLQPSASSAPLRTKGALLYAVESGTVDVAINGTPQTYPQGSTVYVAPDQYYGLLNPYAEPAELIRVSIEPSGEETEVGVGDPPSLTDEHLDVDLAAPERIATRSLLRGDAGRLQPGAALLFVGCLIWEDPGTDSGTLRQPASVGLLVLDGRLRLGESDEMESGRCLMFRPHSAHRLRAGDPAPVLLIFGVIPEGQALWMISGPEESEAPIAAPLCNENV